MIFISGSNKNLDYFIKKNNSKHPEQIPFFLSDIYPQIELTDIISISFGKEHTIWITENGTLYAIGDNTKGQISGSISKEILKTPTKITFDNKNFRFSSVVSGDHYVLYLTLSDHPQLLLVNSLINDGNPTVIPLLENQIPVSLFGGDQNCGIVDSTGSSIIISNMNDPTILYLSLPNDEKIISLSLCNNFFIALSSTGKVYSRQFKEMSNFVEIEELKNIKISQISGKYSHFLALADDGRVFSSGNNLFGELGYSNDIKNCSKFIQIETIDKYYKVINVFAGFNCSFFIVDDGKLLYCGNRKTECGRLITKFNHFIDFVPSDTFVNKGCNFVITEMNFTVIFVNCKQPSNTSNQKIGENLNFVSNKIGDESTPILKKSFLWCNKLYEQSKKALEIKSGYIRVFNYLTKKDNLFDYEKMRNFLKLPEFEDFIYHLTGEEVKNDKDSKINSINHIIQYAQNTSDFFEWKSDKGEFFFKKFLYLFVLKDVTICNLLKKCNSLLNKYKLSVNNFDDDFKDGKVFLALISSAISDENINFSKKDFNEKKLREIIIKHKIPYLLEDNSLKNKDSCLIMFQVYAIIEHIKDDSIFEYNDCNFVYSKEFSPLLKTINGICSKEFGIWYSRLENLMYSPDLLKFVNLLVKDPLLDKILPFSSLSIIKFEYLKKMIDFIIDFLRNKSEKFRIYSFYFIQNEEKDENYASYNINASIVTFFTSLLDVFFVKSNEQEIIKRCNILIGSKKKISSISDFKDGIVFAYLLRFLINPSKNEILNSISFDQITDYFKKANVLMIVDESILKSPESNKNFILYQLQFIFDALDQSSFCHFFIEFIKERSLKFQQIHVPNFQELKKAILANKYFLSLKDANIKHHEIKLKKKNQTIKKPQTYEERKKANESQLTETKAGENFENDDDDENIPNENEFWNPDDENIEYKNGIIYEKSQIIDKDLINEFDLIISKDKQTNQPEFNFQETARSEIISTWMMSKIEWYDTKSRNKILEYSKEKARTPIILFMNSDENDIINLISNTIHQKVDLSEYQDICANVVITPPLSKITNIKQEENKNDEIFPLFTSIHVPEKFKSYPKLETVIMKFNSCFLILSQLVIVILKKNYVSCQIEFVKKILILSEIFNVEFESYNFPDFLFVVNDDNLTKFDKKTFDSFNKSEFVTKLKNKFEFEIHCCLINIDRYESYKMFIDLLNEISIRRMKMIFERKIPEDHVGNLLFGDEREKKKKLFKRKKDILLDPNFFQLYEEAVMKDIKQSKDKKLNENIQKPLTLLYYLNIPSQMSGMYMKIKSNPNIFDAKTILIKRYKQIKKLLPSSSSSSDVFNKLGKEISIFTINSDVEFAKIVNSTKFLISTGFGNLASDIQKELKISSDQRLKYLQSVLHNRIYWTPAQLAVMKNSHIRFLKKEFLDIILLINEKAVVYAFDYFNSIIENQIENDKIKIDLMFKDFFAMIEKKKKTTVKEMKDEIKKSPQYILKERENLKEIKVTLEIGQDLESVIPQDF